MEDVGEKMMRRWRRWEEDVDQEMEEEMEKKEEQVEDMRRK